MSFPLDESYVVATENQLGVRFPKFYREHMMKSNGGDIQAGNDIWMLFPIFDASSKRRIKRTCNDVVSENTRARRQEGFPLDAIAIASDGSGNFLIFKRNHLNNNSIFIWNHKNGDQKLIKIKDKSNSLIKLFRFILGELKHFY